MALVPFRVASAAASQQLGEHLLQVGPHSLLLHQRPKASGNTAHLQRAADEQQKRQDQNQPCDVEQLKGAAGGTTAAEQAPQQQPDLSRVGLVLWQSGYVLSDFLLLRLPQLQAGHSSCSSSWAGARVLELGCGAGTVGMFLALAGAQVVLTDLPHILPLTQENLELNFPLTSKTTASSSSNSSSNSSSSSVWAGTFGQRSYAAVQPIQANQPSAIDKQLERAEVLESAGGKFETSVQKQRQPAAALSASAAFAAAFCGPTAADAQPAGQQQSAEQHGWQVFAAGPLVVEHSWGEPAQQVQQRCTAAAAARLHAAASYTAVQQLKPEQGHQQQQQQQQDDLQQFGSLLLACLSRPFDFVVGADLLYNPAYHHALLDSLQQLCAPHTQVFLCYRCRGLGEDAFQAAAPAAGWAVEAVPCQLLHQEYQGGDYCVLRLTKTG